MPAYNYKVRDASGKVLQGQMDAADAADLRKKLDEHNYFIIEYSEKGSGKNALSFEISLTSSKVTFTDLALFSWQLFTMLDAGLPLVNSLKIITGQTKNAQLRIALADVWRRVEEGASFSEALKVHPKIFSRLYVQMVNAGEVGGVLDDMLRRLALFYEGQNRMKEKIQLALTYPIVLLFVSLGVISFMILYILPRFSKVFADLGATIPAPTQALLDLGVFVKSYWFVFILGAGGLWFMYTNYVRTALGRAHVDRIKLGLPFFGDLIRKAIASRFTQTLATLISGGIPILTALEVVTETIGNVVVARTLKEVSVSVGEGKSIAEPLGQSKIFPDMVIGMIKVGEETGSLDTMLDKISYFYDREVESAIAAFTKMIEPFLIVFMTMVIGFIAVSIFLPMADVMRGLYI